VTEFPTQLSSAFEKVNELQAKIDSIQTTQKDVTEFPTQLSSAFEKVNELLTVHTDSIDSLLKHTGAYQKIPSDIVEGRASKAAFTWWQHITPYSYLESQLDKSDVFEGK